MINELNFDKGAGLMLEHEGKILCEIEEDLSEDEAEILEKRLKRSLGQLKITVNGTIFVLGKLNNKSKTAD